MPFFHGFRDADAAVVSVRTRSGKPQKAKQRRSPLPAPPAVGQANSFAGVGVSVSCQAAYDPSQIGDILGKELTTPNCIGIMYLRTVRESGHLTGKWQGRGSVALSLKYRKRFGLGGFSQFAVQSPKGTMLSQSQFQISGIVDAQLMRPSQAQNGLSIVQLADFDFHLRQVVQKSIRIGRTDTPFPF